MISGAVFGEPRNEAKVFFKGLAFLGSRKELGLCRNFFTFLMNISNGMGIWRIAALKKTVTANGKNERKVLAPWDWIGREVTGDGRARLIAIMANTSAPPHNRSIPKEIAMRIPITVEENPASSKDG